ncbi:tRNA lysidine(34) synthetase TilS [Shinella sp. CPCC 101442]|uniref:tRNA lysidine(34) synthetase TilS n=1 Tax=Shinella sp. CPCC 101442 TaxID=2932265 RepID=UPI002152B446|nr:tRNA lysidine(34) synthetase TilS [Shinella sp. CPCC 101442]MCR6501265.1 tRNA lysidine(34) synthetase TilS [Shinella sp. CPCC 101442]
MARAEVSVVEAAGRFLESFKRPVRLLIAISGGSDSTGLLVALATLCAAGRYPGISLCACTIDHALRPGSAEEAVVVAALCARYGIPHTTRRWDGDKPATALQAAARAKRYELLAEAAIAAGADAILSAHTRDDQNETVAMRAERSAGGVGLSGMADAVLLHGAVWLFRPFLAVDREAVRAFLSAHGETWIDDPSNANTRFERVRVRQRAGVGEQGNGGGDRLALSEKAAGFLTRNVCMENGAFILATEAVDTALADCAAWRGLLVLAATAGGRVHVLETASAERLRAFLASGTLSRLTAGRVVFDRRREGLFLYRECRGIERLVVSAGEAAVWDGRYRVSNGSRGSIVIGAVGNDGHTDGQGLRGPALRARKAMPCLRFEDGAPVTGDVASLEAILAPYAQFLPRFDLPLAAALATVLGAPDFPSPPNE